MSAKSRLRAVVRHVTTTAPSLLKTNNIVDFANIDGRRLQAGCRRLMRTVHAEAVRPKRKHRQMRNVTCMNLMTR